MKNKKLTIQINKPVEEVFAATESYKTWDEFKLNASVWIIYLELGNRYPELKVESRRRRDYWDNLA